MAETVLGRLTRKMSGARPGARELRDVTAVILAGGLGTRLRPTVADRPKGLAPVLNRPFLTHLLDQFAAAAVRRAVLLTGFGAEQVRRDLGTTHAGLTLVHSPEASPLGTAGALRAAAAHLTAPTVLLLNGDSYCHADLAAFAAFHRLRRADVSLVLTRVEDAGRFGRVETDLAGRVTAFAEKQAGGGPGWINAGLYLLARRLLDEIPAGRPVSLEREMLPAWVGSACMYGFPCRGPFLDIGTPESYAVAEAFFASLPAGRFMA